MSMKDRQQSSALPIVLRNKIYGLFQSVLDSPEWADGFDWLSLFVRICEERGMPSIPISELSPIGESKGFCRRGLWALCSPTKVLKLSGADGNILEGDVAWTAISEGKGCAVELFPDRGDLPAYIQDRVPRFQRVIQYLRANKAPGNPLLRDVWVGSLLFNEGLYFDCHEFLEAPWKRAIGREKVMLQGLIQAAAGLHKLELGSKPGCLELLRKAQEKLYLSSYPGLQLDQFVQTLGRVETAIERNVFYQKDPPKADLMQDDPDTGNREFPH